MGTAVYHTIYGDYTVTTEFAGTKSGSYEVNASMSRDIVTADVLDYDGYGDNYALIWKKITISHSQSQLISASATPVSYFPGDSTNLTYDQNNGRFNSSSVRTVEFYLTYKVNGVKTDKLLCTCSMTSTHSLINAVSAHDQTYTGERVWGCSIQVHSDFIVYQFRKEEPNVEAEVNWGGGFGWGGGYDGNLSFESWTVDKEERELWKLKSHIVGLINIKDGVDSEVGYLKEEEYTVGEEGNSMSSIDIYSVGVVNEL
jgi:hypothetical protein